MNKIVPNIIPSSFMSSPENCIPLSDTIWNGRPVLPNTPIKASATDLAVIDLSGTTSGHLVAIQIVVKRY